MRMPQIANVNLDVIAPLPAPLLAAAIAVVAVIIATAVAAVAIVTAVMLPNPPALRNNATVNQKQSKTHHRKHNNYKRSVGINNVKLAAWKVKCKSSVPNGIVPIEEAEVAEATVNGTIPAKTQQNKRVNKVAVALAVVSVSGSGRENVNGIEIGRENVFVSVTIKCDVDVNGIGNESGNGNAAGKDDRSNEIEATSVGIDHVDLPISGGK